MADHLIDRTGGARAAAVVRDLSFEPPPFRRRFLCGLAQAAVAALHHRASMTAQWLGIFITYLLIAGEGFGFWPKWRSLLGVYVGINVATAAIAIAAKWLIIGRIKPGRYPLWGVLLFPLVAGAAPA